MSEENIRIHTPELLPPALLGQIIELEEENVRARNKKHGQKERAWNEEQFQAEGREVIVATSRNQVVGYLVSETHNDHRRILKIESDSTLEYKGIKQRLVEELKIKADEFSPHHAVMDIPVQDTALHKFLLFRGFKQLLNKDGEEILSPDGIQTMGYKGHRAKEWLRWEDVHAQRPSFEQDEPEVRKGIPSHNDDDGDDIEITSTGEHSGDSHHTPHRRTPTLLQRAQTKLTELTNTEWTIVKLDERHKFSPLKEGEAIKDMSDIALQTKDRISNPQRAMNALSKFLGQAPRNIDKDTPKNFAKNRAMTLVVPARWIRLHHFEQGAPGELAEAFMPSDRGARFRSLDEIKEERGRKRRGDNSRKR